MPDFNYPLLLEPIAVPRPWGAGRLCRLYDRPRVDSAQPIGESWDASTWPVDPGDPSLKTVNRILNGPLAGELLDEVTQIPVVVKLLDASEKLSVQAHPVKPDEHKDEMWYILYAEPDAFLFCGLANGVSKEGFCNAVQAQSPDELKVLAMLRKHTNLKPGDAFNVPTGTVHAVGPGLVAFEVSERTQVTYRLFDYHRGRALHLQDGCEAVMAVRGEKPCLDPGLKIAGADSVEAITQFPTFTVTKVTGRRFTVEAAQHKHLLTAVSGDCSIQADRPDWNIQLKLSSTCLLPPTNQAYSVEASGGTVLITSLAE